MSVLEKAKRAIVSRLGGIMREDVPLQNPFEPDDLGGYGYNDNPVQIIAHQRDVRKIVQYCDLSGGAVQDREVERMMFYWKKRLPELFWKYLHENNLIKFGVEHSWRGRARLYAVLYAVEPVPEEDAL